MGNQLIRASGARWLQLNKGHGCFAPFGIGFGDHGARLNAGVAVEGVFYFNGAGVREPGLYFCLLPLAGQTDNFILNSIPNKIDPLQLNNARSKSRVK